MNLLITGAHGFLGKHVTRLMKRKEGVVLFTPTSDQLDLMHPSSISRYLTNNKISHIIHLAANVGGIGANKRKPADFMYNNLIMGLNVLRQASLSPFVKKVVNVGTICSYPKHTPVPFKEEDIFNGYPEETNAAYGIAKRAIMVYGEALNTQHNMRVVNLMPVNMAGEYDNFHPLNSHVIPAIILKIHKAIQNRSTRIELWGTGTATREFLYAGDCARAIGIALSEYETPDPINIGSGEEIKIDALATKIALLMGWDGDIIFTGQVSDGQPRRCLDVVKAEDKLNFKAGTNLDTMLLKEITYFNQLKESHSETIKLFLDMI